MATLKYKDGNEWKKVSIGGGGSTEEVYVGSDAPTDKNVKVWIDPTGTPSGGNGGVNASGANVYILPFSISEDAESGFEFSESEEQKFMEAFQNPTTQFLLIYSPVEEVQMRFFISAIIFENGVFVLSGVSHLMVVQIIISRDDTTGKLIGHASFIS